MSDPLRFEELRETNVTRCETHYHPLHAWSLSDWTVAVLGEAGELAGVVKNIRRGQVEARPNGHEIGAGPHHLRDALADEAADIVIYLDLLCAAAGVDLGAAVRAKFNRVSRERLRTGPMLPDRRCVCGPSIPSHDPETGKPWPHDPSCPAVSR